MASFKELMKALLYETVEEEEDETPEAKPEVTPSVKVEPVQSSNPIRELVHPVTAEPESVLAPAFNPGFDTQPETAAEEEQNEILIEHEDGTEEEEVQTQVNSFVEPAPKPAKPVQARTSAPKQDPKKPYKYDRSKNENSSSRRTPVTAGDYQAVMSPIFGNAEESQKSHESVHNAIHLPKPDSDMVQIISPMFGGGRKKTGSKAQKTAQKKEPVRSIPTYQDAPRHKSAAPGKDLLSAAASSPAQPKQDAPEKTAQPAVQKPAQQIPASPVSKTAAKPARKASDLASFLTREPVKAPKNKTEESESK